MSVTEVNDTNFIGEVENSELPVLLDFYATWCGPCQLLSPTVEIVAAEGAGRFKVCKADVDQTPNLVRRFRIMSVPTLVIFHQGREADRLVGGQSREQILAAMERAAAQ